MGYRNILKSLGRGVNRCFPKSSRKVIFESNSDFCDNTRALYEYLLREGYDREYRFVWCVKDPSRFHCEGMKNTKLVSFQKKSCWPAYLWQLFTSRYVFYTHNPPPFCNPKAQTVLNLWHGTPLKTLAGHVHPASIFTALLSPSPFFDSILAESFDACPEQMIHCGYPRNDLLFESNDSLKKLQINAREYRHISLWMPTFRRPASGDYQDGKATQTGLPLIETEEMLQKLNDKLSEYGIFLIIKLHPGQDMSGIRLLKLSHIRMLTNRELDELGIQLYHLVGSCGSLLTDYSSVYFDYLLLNRPIGFIIDDIDSYQEKRGFTVEDPLSLMPGEQIRTTEELSLFFEHLRDSRDEYVSERKRVNDIVNLYQDGKSAERVAKYFLPGFPSGD